MYKSRINGTFGVGKGNYKTCQNAVDLIIISIIRLKRLYRTS